jgi:hypothetical protein
MDGSYANTFLLCMFFQSIATKQANEGGTSAWRKTIIRIFAALTARLY